MMTTTTQIPPTPIAPTNTPRDSRPTPALKSFTAENKSFTSADNVFNSGVKIATVHNAYAKHSGEETVVQNIHNLLVDNHHPVATFNRTSADIPNMTLGRIRSFASGIYSPSSRRAFATFLQKEKPDIIHIHNLYPLISPSILTAARLAKIPVVMTVHNYRLVCPNGLHLSNNTVCEKCTGGREYNCILNNCESSLPKSIGYAARTAFARKSKLYHNNITLYATLTNFAKQRLTNAGFNPDRIHIIPNMATTPNSPSVSDINSPAPAPYIAFVGRVSPEKGVANLIAAARLIPNIPIKIAGDYSRMPNLVATAPQNVTFLGNLNPAQLQTFYRDSQFLTLPSICFEGFPGVIVEAMLHKKPTACSRIGGLPEIVDENKTGAFFNSTDPADIATTLARLFNDPTTCQTMGAAAYQKAQHLYSAQTYYQNLTHLYNRALELGPANSSAGGCH